MAPIFAVFLAAIPTNVEVNFDVMLMLLPAYFNYVLYPPVLALMLFYTVFRGFFFADKLLMFVFTQVVPSSTFWLTLFTALWALIVSSDPTSNPNGSTTNTT